MKPQDRFEKAGNFEQGTGNSRPRLAKQMLGSILSLALVLATCPERALAYQDAQSGAPPPAQAQAPARTPLTPEQLQQIVAPIALYPDSLVAQILAASTYPEQVVEADRWVQANPNLKGDDLARAVDQQNWDPSVKALTAFPSVLANMDKNISWTSSLGDAYYNQQQDVMDAIQVMRQKAEEAGNLKSTPQQVVTTQGSTIIIQPANPTVVYVPAYNPWVIYGGPIAPWPRWYPYPGIWFGGPFISWGFGFGIGFFGGYGWGWGHWGFNWGARTVVYNHNTYISRSTTFYNRNNFYRGGGHGGVYSHPGVQNRPFNGNARAARGYDAGRAPGAGAHPGGPGAANRPGNAPNAYRGGPPKAAAQSGTHSSAFSGYKQGGQARGEAARGRASMGGSHGGGGGHHR